MAKHLRIGGSTFARDEQCKVWRALSANIPPAPASSYATDGTIKHDWMEKLVQMHDNADDAIAMLENMEPTPSLTPEMIADALIPALRATYDLLDRYDINRASIMLEVFCEIVPGDVGGSIDLSGVSNDGKTVLILDYKFGFVSVSPTTPQLPFYGLAANLDPATSHLFLRAQRIVFAIVQPTGDPVAKVHDVDISFLNDFEDHLYNTIDAVADATIDTAPVSGPQCRFCPALAVCPAKTGAATQALLLDRKGIDTLAQALPLAAELKDWIKAVETLAHQQAENGNPIPGYKLVNKRAMRVWNDPDAALKKIKHAKNVKTIEACDVKLKSPPQLEKLCKAKKIPFKPYLEYISAVSSGTTLAKQSDKRPEALAAASLEEMVALTS